MDNDKKLSEALLKADGINPAGATESERIAFAKILDRQSKPKRSKPAPRPNIWRIIMKSKITKLTAAAAILIVIGVLYVGLNGGSVSAAEMFEEIIAHNQGYQGWIHISNVHKTLKEETEDVERMTVGIRHMNTVDGTLIGEIKTDNDLNIKYYSPADKEYIEYSSLKKEVTIYDLNSFPARQLVAGYPLTVDARIRSFKEVTGKDPYDITITQEGDYDRFDVVFFKNKEEEVRISKEKSTGFCSNMTLWVDRNTRLIYRSYMEVRYKDLGSMTPVSGMKISSTVKYGEPFIDNIYDLDVPEDAVVVDHRKTLAVKDVLERLTTRAADFNHYVALMTKTKINDDGTLKDSCTLHLFAQDGEAWLVNGYPVGAVSYPHRPEIVVPSIKETPENLLSLDLISVLDRIKHAHLWGYFVFDGENFRSNEATVYKDGDIKQQTDSIKADRGLLSNIWHGRKYGHGTKTKLLNRGEESNQLGLYIEYYSYPPPYKKRNERYYWFDPDRDDMPIEILYRSYLEDDTTVDIELRTVYLDYSQLLDGRWYPARWQTTTTSFDEEHGYKETHEYQLTLSTDIELEEDWFTQPNQKTVN